MVNGDKIADDYNDLTDGDLDSRIDLTETGTFITGQTFWTSTTFDRQLTPTGDGDRHCQNWTSSSSDDFGYVGVNDLFADEDWTHRERAACSFDGVRIYCFEQEQEQAEPPSPVPTTNQWTLVLLGSLMLLLGCVYVRRYLY